MVSVAMSAILSVCDFVNAMELRAFGSRKRRIWYTSVKAKGLDRATFLVKALCWLWPLPEDDFHDVLNPVSLSSR
jgi:energy-coupling factor transporter transmembrane protein EcfT